ncbi:aldo-keto reductase [Coniosporium apollinis CBS 100218]|uniref:Aldo-keto reductase n=1 Tax=Coniosporium apollinis (strain CBS 100218) TaxID=1168221 RepID=R7YGP6_CONA1|nr:aldo-keto reductase [Coniosporium apollinis CBS 100218]EON61067.1 aldo-keto reductase [Coniosporium apollinis CBS 100218]
MSSEQDAVLKSLEETKVDYRRLGNSGLRVSVPVLGAMSFGSKEWQPWVIEEEEGIALLKAAYDRGLNTWDTANIYSNGVSEEIIGKAIKKHNIPRDKLVILSKCRTYVGEKPSVNTGKHGDKKVSQTKDYVNQGGLSRKAIFKAVNDSLKRMDTPYMDLLQIHRFDPETPIEETMEALHDLVKAGKVLHIGASSMWTYQFVMMQNCAEKHGWTKFISMQNHYSLLYREEEREMNAYCRLTGVGLLPWSPLARGHLARPPSEQGSTERSKGEGQSDTLTGHLEVDKKIIERVQELAKKHGWTMSQVALAWINTKVTSPIVGFSSVERMDEAIGVRGKSLTDDEIKYLEELYQPRPIEGHN